MLSRGSRLIRVCSGDILCSLRLVKLDQQATSCAMTGMPVELRHRCALRRIRTAHTPGKYLFAKRRWCALTLGSLHARLDEFLHLPIRVSRAHSLLVKFAD